MKAVKLTPLPTIKSAQVAPHADPVQDAKLPVGDAAAELEPELLQTAAAFEFDWAVTAKQLVVHFFLPFSIPLYTAVRGRRAARNQMLFLSAKTLVPSYLLPACFWVVALSMVARSEQLRQDGISLVEPLMSLVVTLFQRLVIAVKWGFLTPAERRKFYSAPDDATADRWHAETQLASGWLVPNGQLIKHELDVAAEQLQIRLDDVVFEVPLRANEGEGGGEGEGEGKDAGASASTDPDAPLWYSAWRRYLCGASGASGARGARGSGSGADSAHGLEPDEAQELVDHTHHGAWMLKAGAVKYLLSSANQRRTLRQRKRARAVEAAAAEAAAGESRRLGGVLVREAEGVALVPAKVLLSRMVALHGVSVPMARIFTACGVVGIALGLLGPLSRVFRDPGSAFLGKPGASSVTQATVVCSCVLNTFFAMVLFIFQCVFVIDMQRKFALARGLRHLLRRPNGCSRELGGTEQLTRPPMLDLTRGRNVRAWVDTEALVRRLGSRYCRRLHVYTALSGMVLLLLIGVLAKHFILGFSSSSQTTKCAPVAASRPQAELRTDLAFLYATFLVPVFSSLIVAAAVLGTLANTEYRNMKLMITRQRLHLLSGTGGSTPDSGDSAHICDLLDLGVQQLEYEGEISPVSVLGVPAEWSTVVSIVTIVFSSFVLGLIQQWVKNN